MTDPHPASTSREARRGTGLASRSKDNGAVNVEVHPEYPVGYSCYDEAGEFYNAMVSPDGVLLSLSPVHLKPAKS
jgi:hypothetical protein